MKTLNEHLAFGGTQRFHQHDSAEIGLPMRFALFTPPQPRALLAGIPELTVVEIAEPDLCCGSAGTYNLLQPEAASALGDRKAVNVDATGAELLVAANPGCSMQIATALQRRGAPIAVAHTAQVLDASLRGLGRDALVGRTS